MLAQTREETMHAANLNNFVENIVVSAKSKNSNVKCCRK